MKKLYVFLLFILPLALLPAGVSADKAKPAPKKAKAANKNQATPPELMTDEEFESQLKYQHGTISLGNGIATLNVSVDANHDAEMQIYMSHPYQFTASDFIL